MRQPAACECLWSFGSCLRERSTGCAALAALHPPQNHSLLPPTVPQLPPPPSQPAGGFISGGRRQARPVVERKRSNKMGKSGEHAVVGQPGAAGPSFSTPNAGGGRKARPGSASSSGPASGSTPGERKGRLGSSSSWTALAPAAQPCAAQASFPPPMPCLADTPAHCSVPAVQCPPAHVPRCMAAAPPAHQQAHQQPCLAAAPAAAGGAPAATLAVLPWMPK